LKEGEAKHLGRLEIDGEFELLRLLHRQVARFGAIENPGDMTRCTPELVGGVNSVAHERTP
jgi:hypothetical protein